MTFTLDIVALVINALCAMRALVIVTRALPVLGRYPKARRRLIITGTLLTVYIAGYALIVAGLVDRLAWSKALVMIGPLAWLYVWPSLAELGVELAQQMAALESTTRPRLEAARANVHRLTARVDRVA